MIMYFNALKTWSVGQACYSRKGTLRLTSKLHCARRPIKTICLCSLNL